MKSDFLYDTRAWQRQGMLALVLGFAALLLSACNERSPSDGKVINELLLPTDVVLNLFCPDVGLNTETCVLDDPENPFATAAVPEPDQVPDADGDGIPDYDDKFALAAALPQGPSGAKARFYLWATALARRQTGENQWYTARALHELYDANSNLVFEDELIKEHAKRAYRSVLDNFWGQVTFFDIGGVLLPFQLNEAVARDIYYPDETGFRPVVDSQIQALELLGDWGYTYDVDNDRLSRNQ